jgi:hypothetical protein
MRGHRGFTQYIIARWIVISQEPVKLYPVPPFAFGVLSPAYGITSGTPLQNLNPTSWPRLPLNSHSSSIPPFTLLC